MTSVKDNVTKVSEYIMSCRQMGIKIMPPDINEGEGGFSVSDGAIRYGLSAIKSIGQSVVDEIVRERTEHGKFRSLEDFIDRMSGREVNKRTLESFIKSGAMDGLPGTRKQKSMVCGSMVDQKNKEKKNTMEGQMSLFDFAAEEDEKSFSDHISECRRVFEGRISGIRERNAGRLRQRASAGGIYRHLGEKCDGEELRFCCG